MVTIQPVCGPDIMSRQKAGVAAHDPVVMDRPRGPGSYQAMARDLPGPPGGGATRCRYR